MINTGNIPAKFVVDSKENILYRGISWTSLEPESGVVFPGQKVDLGWLVEWDHNEEFESWVKESSKGSPPAFSLGAKINVIYSDLGDYENSYNTTIKSEFSIIDNDKNNFSISWKIEDAN